MPRASSAFSAIPRSEPLSRPVPHNTAIAATAPQPISQTTAVYRDQLVLGIQLKLSKWQAQTSVNIDHGFAAIQRGKHGTHTRRCEPHPPHMIMIKR